MAGSFRFRSSQSVTVYSTQTVCRRCIIEYVMAHNKCPRCLDLTACSQIIETDQLKADLQMDAIIRELVSHLVKGRCLRLCVRPE